MTCSRQLLRWWMATFLFAAGPIVTASGQGTNAPVNMAPMPPQHSPVDSFRQLLAMSPRDREHYLSNKPPEIHARLADKVKEYQALGADERELRLRATELRWYLLPLLRESATNRASILTVVPANLRDLIASRLAQWDALSTGFQKEFLDNERTLRYFTRVDATNPVAPGRHPQPAVADKARWDALSEADRQKITDQFNQFFELTSDEKQKTLGTLSPTERAQMEKTLQAFDNLPPVQRMQCVRAFTKFTEMSFADRAQFLKSAERWSQLSPKERQAWRDLVAEIPQWPPLPQGNISVPMPPMPKAPAVRARPQVATN